MTYKVDLEPFPEIVERLRQGGEKQVLAEYNGWYVKKESEVVWIGNFGNYQYRAKFMYFKRKEDAILFRLKAG